MALRDALAAAGIIIALITAAVSYGQMRSELADARTEIALLREDMAAINQHFITWAGAHTESAPPRRTR